MPALAIPAAIGLGGTIINAITGSRAATNVSNLQTEAARQAAAASLQAGQQASAGVNQAAATATGNVNAATQAAIEAARTGTQQGNQTLEETLGRQRTNLDPYLQAGRTGVEGLQREATGPNQDFRFDVNDFRNDPSYRVILDEANQAITRSAAARGISPGSGGVLKALSANSVAQLQKSYGDVYARSENTFRANQQARRQTLGSLASLGQTATGQLNQAEGQAGSAIAGNQVDLGVLTGAYGTEGARTNANIDTTAALNSGRFLTDATANANDANLQGANAAASGVIGRANAWRDLTDGVTNIGVGAANRYFDNTAARRTRMMQRLPAGVNP